MFKQPEGGLVISFDGLECAGKGTYIKRLTDWLDTQGLKYIVVGEPGGPTELGGVLRSTFLSYQGICPPEVEVGLLAASFKNNEVNVINPALNKDLIVIMDRTDMSTQAYQIGGCDYDVDLVHNILDSYNLDILPDLRFYLHVSTFESLRRMTHRGVQNRMDAKDPAFYERTAMLFNSIITNSSDIIAVDTMSQGDESEEATINRVFENIITRVTGLLVNTEETESDVETASE